MKGIVIKWKKMLLKDISGIRSEDFPKRTVNTVSVYGQEKYLVLEASDLHRDYYLFVR